MRMDEVIDLALGVFSARFGHEDIVETTRGSVVSFSAMWVIEWLSMSIQISGSSRFSPMAKGGADPS
jgi:hypothetical protein